MNHVLFSLFFFISSTMASHNDTQSDTPAQNKSFGHLDDSTQKNHSETVQQILTDFEKTLDENKKLYDLDMVDSAATEIEDIPNVEDVVTDEENVTLSGNATTDEGADNSTKTRLACNNTEPLNVTYPLVLMVNATQYQAYLVEEHNSSVANRSQLATCSVTMFFAPWCQFSAEAAPHYNALARVFPQLRLYAVDSSEHYSLNTQYGVMAVPSIFVFHNSRPLYKYNFTEYNLASFTQFVSLLTGLEPENITELSEDDYLGPVPCVPKQTTNYYLLLAFIFTFLCGLWHVSTSHCTRWLLDTVRNLWREAEIQHEHED